MDHRGISVAPHYHLLFFKLFSYLSREKQLLKSNWCLTVTYLPGSACSALHTRVRHDNPQGGTVTSLLLLHNHLTRSLHQCFCLSVFTTTFLPQEKLILRNKTLSGRAELWRVTNYYKIYTCFTYQEPILNCLGMTLSH